MHVDVVDIIIDKLKFKDLSQTLKSWGPHIDINFLENTGEPLPNFYFSFQCPAIDDGATLMFQLIRFSESKEHHIPHKKSFPVPDQIESRNKLSTAEEDIRDQPGRKQTINKSGSLSGSDLHPSGFVPFIYLLVYTSFLYFWIRIIIKYLMSVVNIMQMQPGRRGGA